jgi:hypothetical protein
MSLVGHFETNGLGGSLGLTVPPELLAPITELFC